MSKIYNNILETVGNTPLVRLNNVVGNIDSEILAKVEFFNPGGSVKDRIGVSMIKDAEKKGLLKPGGTIVEGTSGNTGMGLAIAAAVMGYKCVFVLPDKMSQEKIRNLRAFGAKVVVTPTAVEPDDPRSYYMVSRRLAQEIPNAVYLNQYDNLSNRQAHIESTGPELYNQLDGKFDAFVAGMGTGGTITGTAMYLKKMNPKIQIIGVDPIGSILYEYSKTGKMGEAHPYKIEGIGEDIIPKNFDFSFIDDVVQVNDKESFLMTRKLLLNEGLFCGVSCGAAVVGAIRYAQGLQKQGQGKKRIIVLMPDSGNRYLSKVFDDDWMRENGFLDDSDRVVRDLTSKAQSKKIIVASPEDSVEKIVHLMSDKGISQIPVVKAGQLRGIVSETNLLNTLFNGKINKTDSISSIIEQNFVKVNLDDPLAKLAQIVSAGQIPIVFESGEVTAIITKIDLISFMSQKN